MTTPRSSLEQHLDINLEDSLIESAQSPLHMDSDYFISDNNDSLISNRHIDDSQGMDVSKLEESFSEMHTRKSDTEKIRDNVEEERKSSNNNINTDGNKISEKPSDAGPSRQLKSALSSVERKDSTGVDDLTPRKGRKPVIRYKDQEDDS